MNLPKPHVKIHADDIATVRLEITCPLCSGQTILSVPKTDLVAWVDGAYVQDAFPGLSPDDRERLISGICPPCYEKLFPEEDK